MFIKAIQNVIFRKERYFNESAVAQNNIKQIEFIGIDKA